MKKIFIFGNVLMILLLALIINVTNVYAFASSTHLPYLGTKTVTNLHNGTSLGENGIDFAVPVDTNLYASGEGTISTVSYGYNGGWGNYLLLGHPESYISRYAHLNSIDKSQGTYVYQGTQLAKSGNTGFSTGPHLHFQQYRYGSSSTNSVKIAPLFNYTNFYVNSSYNNSSYDTNWYYWNLNTTPEGWWLQNAEDLGVYSGQWRQNPAGDPKTRSPRFVGINASYYKKVKVRFAAYGGGTDTGIIYFSKTKDPMNFVGNQVNFSPVIKDGVIRDYLVDMYNSSSNYRGTIYGLRIDPIINGISGDSDKIYIDSVQFMQ